MTTNQVDQGMFSNRFMGNHLGHYIKISTVLHVKNRQTLNFHFDALMVSVFHTLVFFTLICSCRAQSQLTGPSQPIVAVVGDDIILPCRLQPAVDASDMSMEWTRPDLDPRFVHVLHDRKELQSLQHPSYRERTSLFTDELKNGNISLKLSKVKPADEGKYRCFIPGISRDSTVQLVVVAVSSPVIQTYNQVVLQCESKGWYPEPELLWLDAEGKILSAGPTETVRGPDDLYTVSSRVTVEKRHSNNITCRVQQSNINQTRETQIKVTDDFFPDQSKSSSTSGSSILFIIIGFIAVNVFILAAVLFVWKWRKRKSENKRHHTDEETQRVTEDKSNESENKPQMVVRQADSGHVTPETQSVKTLLAEQNEEETGI